MSTVMFHRVHEIHEVEKIVAQAVEIANAQTTDPVTWRPIFEKSCDLLGARVPVVQPTVAAPFDLNGLRS